MSLVSFKQTSKNSQQSQSRRGSLNHQILVPAQQFEVILTTEDDEDYDDEMERDLINQDDSENLQFAFPQKLIDPEENITNGFFNLDEKPNKNINLSEENTLEEKEASLSPRKNIPNSFSGNQMKMDVDTVGKDNKESPQLHISISDQK